MTIGKTINSALARIDLAIVRRSSLDRILTELRALQDGSATVGLLPAAEALAAPTGASLGELRRDLLRHQIATKWAIVDAWQRSRPGDRRSRSCPLCGYQAPGEAFAKLSAHCIFGGGELLRHRCPGCDVVFGPDKMLELSDAELSEEYEWHYRAYDEGDSTPQELRAFHCLNPERNGTYLNYGAGAWSHSVPLLRDQGWQVLAYEPHGAASSGAAYVVSDRQTLAAMRFDGVFSNNVLEHLRRPADELSFMASLLKPGGRMSHATPCFDYLYEYTRFHLFFFLGRSRGWVARAAGLSIEELIVDGEFMCCILEPM